MKPVACLPCAGSGKAVCGRCKGTGRAGGFLGIGRSECGDCAASGKVACAHCAGSGVDHSPNAGLRSDGVETRRETVELLGQSDDAAAFNALRDFRDHNAAGLEAVRESVQAALSSIRARAVRQPPALREGMTTAELVALMGPPTSTEQGSAIAASYGRASSAQAAQTGMASRGYWMFRHPAGDYGVVIAGGRVQTVYTFPYAPDARA